MQTDPATEWQRLTRLYGEKSDEELLDLGDDFGNLTEVAQQVLRDETKKRGLAPQEPKPKPEPDRRPVFAQWSRAGAEQNSEPRSGEQETGAQDPETEDLPREYTWKTLLRACDTREEAWQISEVLKRAGIDSWIEAPAQGSLDVTGPRVVVAADQLEEAHAIAARPIPQDIIDQAKTPVEDFQLPTCPRCGAADPLLESVEPCNQWKCETCGAEWKDAVVPAEEA